MILRHTSFLISSLLALELIGCSASKTVSTTQDAPLPPASQATPAAPIANLDSVLTPTGTFFTLPYLQLGEEPTATDAMAIVWHTTGTNIEKWSVETRSPETEWKTQNAKLRSNPVAVGVVAPHTVYTQPLSGLTPGMSFDYRILKAGKPVFAARVNRARPAPNQDYRMVIFGDCAEDTAWQKKVAYQTALRKPDAILITGDIVYPRGRASEYRSNFFPVYSVVKADPRIGAPLLSTTLFIGVSGNHDLDYANLSKNPDGLAYYYYWKQPLNGWGSAKGSDRPQVSGLSKAFTDASGKAFPNGANYWFDYGNAHFVAIDSNYYMNWRDPELVAGLRKALMANPSATWRFVVLHVAPFHSSEKHQNEQWIRRLAPVFEECGVDVVWSGHVHNYQRSFPLRFAPKEATAPDGKIDGEFTLDTSAPDGKMVRPNGVVYMVTGAGGAALYTKQNAPTLAPYTAKYDADIHSFTEMSVHDKTLSVQQVDENGKEVDHWSITK